MGRHGKNLRQRPARVINLGPIYPERLLTQYEKQMLNEATKMEIVRKATDAAMAATASILLYHMPILENSRPDERLLLFYALFQRALRDKLDNPDEKQQFAEWYWTTCTGNPLVRADKEKEYKMAKKYSYELSMILKKHIDAQGYCMQDIVTECSISRGVYNNIIGGGSYSKKSFDTVAAAVGFEMDDSTKELYNKRFGIGNRQDQEKIERFEELSKELEQPQPVPEPETEKAAAKEAEAAPNAAPEPEPEEQPASEPVKIPVGEGLEAVVEQVINHEQPADNKQATADEQPADDKPADEEEELPFSDFNPMYSEALEDGSTIPIKKTSKLVHPDDLMDSLECYITKIDDFKITLKAIKEEARKLEKFIKMLELLNENQHTEQAL